MSLLKSLNRSENNREVREFSFSEADFDFIKQFMLKETGISLADRKYSMVYGRLARRLRRHGFFNFKDYLRLVETDPEERVAFINALTTNKTQFFRERHHFDFITNHLIPQWQDQNQRHVRIWSAGCSTGEEAYSIAITLALSDIGDTAECRVMATDLDTHVLGTARDGMYNVEASRSISIDALKVGFQRGTGSKQDLMRIKPDVKRLVTFKQLNLMTKWDHKNKMDVIFFRNVMIYFDRKVQQQLLQRFYEQLRPGGVLLIGHSENIGDMGQYFENLGQTIYRKL
ncbi:chemotaxis protein CheR [Veronia nyctiphanis]|uniref:Chemotaxis protein methyltransferase n=1 Tax=Veronia nyctiphanis TaxID=1278244 RepID=A0A4V1LSP7_9GAMM|nr:protein-glutamate O-methyltransferase CheR [Veronia nyctiphanis]RXJ72438.1 chemotaxis protein CheR [Veronia nyctiphanis]